MTEALRFPLGHPADVRSSLSYSEAPAAASLLVRNKMGREKSLELKTARLNEVTVTKTPPMLVVGEFCLCHTKELRDRVQWG